MLKFESGAHNRTLGFKNRSANMFINAFLISNNVAISKQKR